MGEIRDTGNQNQPDPEQSGSDEPKPPRSATFRNLIGRLRLRSVLTLSMVLLVVLAIGITGLLSFYNSQYAVNDLASLLQDEVSDRIVQHLDTYLETPHHINHLCLDSIRLGEISIHDRESLRRHFQELSYRYPSFQSIFFASQADGNYTIVSSVGADGAANGTERYNGYADISTNGSFEEYLINRHGLVIKKTFDLEQYDPRTRDWYKTAVKADGPAWTPIYMWLEGVVSLDAVVPFYSDERELIGVQGSSMTLTGIGDFLKALKISSHGQAFIIEHSGLIVASSTINEPFHREGDTLVRYHATEVNNTVISSAGRYILDTWGDEEILTRQQFFIDIEGSRYFFQVTPYQGDYGLDWLIVVAIPSLSNEG